MRVKPNRSNAARLNANERIVRRVAELQASAAKRTIEHIALTEADFIARLIREADHYGEGSSHSARVQAVRLIGDHLGLLKARVEHDVSDALADLIAHPDDDQAERLQTTLVQIDLRAQNSHEGGYGMVGHRTSPWSEPSS